MTDQSLVIGASGFVGQYLYRALPEDQRTGTYYQQEAQGLLRLDWTDDLQIRELLRRCQPNLIFVPASWTHVDACEDDPDRCMSLNDGGMKLLCEAVDPEKARIVYFSTDYVFDGKDGPYSEDSQTAPINVYGESKLSAERRVLAHSDRNLVIRTTVVYGWEQRGKNSMERLIRGLRTGQSCRAPVDQWGNPTYVENLVEVSLDLVKLGMSGIFNVCGSEWINRYQLALMAARVFQLPEEFVEPIKTPQLNQRATRPMRAGMKVAKALAATSHPLLTPFQGLTRMKAREELWGINEG
ncbi:MAG: SDR family oxidoreductase [Planctomycetota bacterium]|nr:SDR family oxidoreductase [Planctomycetota bacterium]